MRRGTMLCGKIKDITRSWRDDPATEKQLAYILEMNEFSPYPLPEFKGTTKGEACDYINKYTRKAHESPWAIEHGY